jgi:hypothetical protein
VLRLCILFESCLSIICTTTRESSTLTSYRIKEGLTRRPSTNWGTSKRYHLSMSSLWARVRWVRSTSTSPMAVARWSAQDNPEGRDDDKHCWFPWVWDNSASWVAVLKLPAVKPNLKKICCYLVDAWMFNLEVLSRCIQAIQAAEYLQTTLRSPIGQHNRDEILMYKESWSSHGKGECFEWWSILGIWGNNILYKHRNSRWLSMVAAGLKVMSLCISWWKLSL